MAIGRRCQCRTTYPDADMGNFELLGTRPLRFGIGLVMRRPLR